MRELEDSIEEDLITNADLSMARRRLDEELASEREKHRKEMAENEQVLETIKRKYQKEIRQMVTEIELERANVQKMRDTHKQLAAELEEVNNRFDQELRSNQSWKKDKERLEAKINDLTQSYQNALTTQDDQQVQIVNLLSQVREYRAALDEAQAARAALEKIKRGLEQRLDDVGEQFHTVTQNKQTAERIRMALDQEAGDLRERLEEQQFLVNVSNEKLRKAELAVVEAEGELSKERAQCEEALRAKVCSSLSSHVHHLFSIQGPF
jgi:myosin protein heavy chain